jgi:hypothetical protein
MARSDAPSRKGSSMADPNSNNGGIFLYIGLIIAVACVISAGVYFAS